MQEFPFFFSYLSLQVLLPDLLFITFFPLLSLPLHQEAQDGDLVFRRKEPVLQEMLP